MNAPETITLTRKELLFKVEGELDELYRRAGTRDLSEVLLMVVERSFGWDCSAADCLLRWCFLLDVEFPTESRTTRGGTDLVARRLQRLLIEAKLGLLEG